MLLERKGFYCHRPNKLQVELVAVRQLEWGVRKWISSFETSYRRLG